MPHVLLHRFTKHETPFALGRHLEHDSRSRSFTIEVPPVGVPRKSVLWPHRAPVLNQMKLGACTGFAMTQLLNCCMYAPTRKKVKGTDGWLTDADAILMYGLATHLDGFGPENYYPPNDDGSTGLGVAKAAEQDGFIDSYQHAYTVPQLQAALATQPVIAGTSWTNSMFRCDPVTGFVTVGPINDSTIAGGHEYAILGVDYQLQCFVMLNNWSDKWGGGDGLAPGYFRVKFTDYEELLANDGDIIIPHCVGLA